MVTLKIYGEKKVQIKLLGGKVRRGERMLLLFLSKATKHWNLSRATKH
jgi:hypothetical protein